MTLEDELRMIINEIETASTHLKSMKDRLAGIEARLEQTKTA